jgi:hypothetical protein
MKVGEIKQAIQELSDENFSLRQKLHDAKFMVYRLQLDNFTYALSEEQINFVNSHNLVWDNNKKEIVWD